VLRQVSVEASSKRVPWLKVALLVGAVVIGVGVGIGVAIAQSSGRSKGTTLGPGDDPGTTFPAGARRAPDFTLEDQAGRTISMRSLRGRPVVIAFIDPVCRNLCPLEAKVLNDVPRALPAATRPVIVAVSVNPWNQSRADLRLDAQRWHLTPDWRWAIGSYAALSKVWDGYAIGVQVQTRKLAGVTVHTVAHTEAAYVIDPAGFERALFVYPYRSGDVVNAVRRATAGRSSSSQR